LTKELNTEMYSCGPFLPDPKTPLAKVEPVSEARVLKVLALARLTGDKEAKILVTTGFETLSSDARKLGLLAGANSVMLNVTPIVYRKKYSIYPKRAHAGESIQEQVDDTIALLKSIGRAPTDLGVKADRHDIS
jgi:biotin synthase